MDREVFISYISPDAVMLRAEGSPIFPSVRIAQALLETGGQIPEWNNVFGIKVGDGVITPYWDGKYVERTTREVIEGKVLENVRAEWRAYKSVEASILDHELFLQRPRYAAVRAAQTPKEQCDALYQTGYATDAPREVDGDPSYAEKLWGVIVSSALTRYDEEADRLRQEMEARLRGLESAHAVLAARIASLEGAERLKVVPDWARPAVERAVQTGLIDTPEGGSYDFYRLLAVMHRLGRL